MTSSESTVIIQAHGKQKNGKHAVSARTADGLVLHMARIDLLNEEERSSFVQMLREKCPGIQDDEVNRAEDALLELADETLPSDGPTKTQADKIVELIGEDVELFHSPEQDAYVTFRAGNRFETHRVASKTFKRWIYQQYYLKNEKTIGSQALADALSIIEAKASFEGPCCQIHVRIGEKDGVFYIDVGDEQWRVVRIAGTGWAILDKSPIKFLHPRGILPLPLPERSGNLLLLRKFFNCGSENDWILIIAWLVAALQPRGPYPIQIGRAHV